MNVLALVSKFQEKLDVSRANAVWRVIGFLFLLAGFVATIAVSTIFFPYADNFTEEVSLLPGNHIQVQEILDGEVRVNRIQFLQTAEGNATFVALDEKAIVYMTKVAGVSYRYNQTAPAHFDYRVSSQKIQNGLVIREMTMKTQEMIISHTLLPLVVLFFLFIGIVCIQAKRVSGWGSGAVYCEVWL